MHKGDDLTTFIVPKVETIQGHFRLVAENLYLYLMKTYLRLDIYVCLFHKAFGMSDFVTLLCRVMGEWKRI